MIQEYDKYVDEDHEVWSILYSRMMEILPRYSSQAYLEGIQDVGLEGDRIPNFDECNVKLSKKTGWKIYVVPGLIDNKPFFEHLSNREFPSSTWLRKKSQLEYLEEPDMFHDIFGHVPLLANLHFANFLSELAGIALEHIENEWAVEILSRLYWYTVEFGLIKEGNGLKVYGAGILSSSGETQYSIDSDIPQRMPYDVKKIFQTPYIKDKFQEQYFVIDSYEQLYKSIPEIKSVLAQELKSAAI
ncbi:MAG: phenylalanine 4-monooxygenase [Chitinophagales bacterium]|nr:phenylalanine 4-monooxygenase [Chitinophagales bacterium]